MIEIKLVLLLKERVLVLVFVLAILNVHQSLVNDMSVVKDHQLGLSLRGVLPCECNFRIPTVYQSIIVIRYSQGAKLSRKFLTSILFELLEPWGKWYLLDADFCKKFVLVWVPTLPLSFINYWFSLVKYDSISKDDNVESLTTVPFKGCGQ